MIRPDTKAAADQLRRILAAATTECGETPLSVSEKSGTTSQVVLTPQLSEMVLDLLRAIHSGAQVRLVPVDAEMTTQEAADLLNVSRPYLVSLLETSAIPHRKVGRHRRIRAEDVFAYKSERDTKRAEALDALMARDADLGLV